MSELFKSLIKSGYEVVNNGDFWGNYAKLNSISKKTTPEQLLKIQAGILKSKKNNPKIKQANELLKELGTDHGKELAEINNEIIYIFNRMLISGVSSLASEFSTKTAIPKKNPSDKTKYFYHRSREQAGDLIKEMTAEKDRMGELLSHLKNGGRISDQFMNDFMNSVTPKGYYQKGRQKQYIQAKSQDAEILTQEIFNDIGWTALVSGKWTYNGKQIIEDVFAINKENRNKEIINKNGTIGVTINLGGVNNFFKTYGQLFDSLQNFHGTLELTDELYDIFKIGSDIAAQVKSGVSQDILNYSEALDSRNSISLKDLNFIENSFDLYDLYLYHNAYFKEESSQSESEEMKALANYALSKGIAKTNLIANNIYVTKEGFATASQWMEKNRRYLAFKPGIGKLSTSIYETSFPYAFTSIGLTK